MKKSIDKRISGFVDLYNRKGMRYLISALLKGAVRKIPYNTPLPPFIQIEPTTFCNLRCEFCEKTYWDYKEGNMDFEKFKTLINEFGKSLKFLDITGIGAGMLHPNFFDMIAYAKSRHIKVAFNDNFTLLDAEKAKKIIKLGVDEIVFSLDSTDKKIYEKLRKGANFEDVISNAKRLVALKKDHGSNKPSIVINTVITRYNLHDMPNILDIAKEIGIKRVSFTHVFSFEETKDLVVDKDQASNAIKKAQIKAQDMGIKATFYGFSAKLPYKQCYAPWLFSYITFDGYIHPCCQVSQVNDRDSTNKIIGNAFEESYKKIWNSTSYKKLRKSILRNQGMPYCKNCPAFTK